MRWLGTNGVEFVYKGQSVLLDPYLTRSLNEICVPDRVAAHLEHADIVFVGHSHWDHLADVPEIARRFGARVIGSRTTRNICLAMGVPASQLKEVKAGETLQENGFQATFLTSCHKQPMLYPGTYETMPKAMSRVSDFLEGGTFALLFDFGGLRVLNLGSANFVPDALEGIACDYLLLGISGRAPDFLPKLMRCVTVGVVVPTHFDFFDTPLEAAGERVSLSTFEREMREIGWTAEVRIPKPLEWVDWGGEPACT